MIKGISMALMYVSDIAESVVWYHQTLDLPVLYQDQGFASLGVGNQRLGLHAGEAASGDRSGGMPVFDVDNYSEAKAELESRGCDFYFENESPNAIFGSFRDPVGNSLQIMQDR